MELREFEIGDEVGVRGVLSALGWTNAQVDGQIDTAESLAASSSGLVVVAVDNEELIGFVSVEYYAWNQLAQVQGMAVAPDRRRQGIASRLVERAEEFVRTRGARGIYVDTPANNAIGRALYEAVGYTEAYVMPRYYSDESDGVTFIKFFE